MSGFDRIAIGLHEIPISQIERWEEALHRARVLLARYADSEACGIRTASERTAARRTRIQLQGLAEVLERVRTEHEREVESLVRGVPDDRGLWPW